MPYMKRAELFFAAALVPLDFLALIAAGFAAYWARFLPAATAIRPVIFDLTFQEFSSIVIPVALIWVAIFAISGLYTMRRDRLTAELSKVIIDISAGIAVVFAILFFTLQAFES